MGTRDTGVDDTSHLDEPLGERKVAMTYGFSSMMAFLANGCEHALGVPVTCDKEEMDARMRAFHNANTLREMLLIVKPKVEAMYEVLKTIERKED